MENKLKNYENHEDLRIPCGNHDHTENVRNPYDN